MFDARPTEVPGDRLGRSRHDPVREVPSGRLGDIGDDDLGDAERSWPPGDTRPPKTPPPPKTHMFPRKHLWGAPRRAGLCRPSAGGAAPA